MRLLDIFRPKWKNSDYHVRKAAIESLTSQVALAVVAKTEIHPMLRLNAAMRLTDRALAQDVFADIAKSNTQYELTIREAFEKLNDEAALADVAKNSHHLWMRLAAVDKLSEQTLLVKIASSASMRAQVWSQWSDYPDYVEDSGGRAVNRLVDQNLLAVVVGCARDEAVRKAAARKLTDQGVLAKAYKSIDDLWVRMEVVKNITDQALLAQIAKSNDLPGARAEAIKNLTDQALVAQIVKNEPSHDYYVGHIAADRLADLEIAKVRNLTDQAELAKIAKNYEVRIAAAETPTDQAPPAEIVKNIRKRVRIAAVETLADQALLTSIARSDGEYYVCRAAVERLADLARDAEIEKRAGGHGPGGKNSVLR
jgi:hypothetical protein